MDDYALNNFLQIQAKMGFENKARAE